MSAIGTYPVVVAELLGLACLACALVAVYVLVETWMLGLGRVRALAAGAFGCTVALFWTIDAACYSTTHPGVLVVLSPYLSRLSLVLYVILLGALGVVLGKLLTFLRAERRSLITPDSVKEAVDALPDGVCFSELDGAPVLVNVQMSALSNEALGVPVKNEGELWARLCAGDCMAGYVVRGVDAQAGKALLVCPDGRAWQFSRRMLVVDGRDLVETIAADVTEEHALLLQLAERNRMMAEVNERLRAYGRDLTRLTREEEVLAAKVRVHNEVGRALVALRAYERQEPDRRDRDQLLGLWLDVAHLLEGAGREEEMTDDWVLLRKAAEAVDVCLELDGELPREPEARRLACLVVHECLNNAVRHGDAHTVSVSCIAQGDTVELSVTNDGKVPAAPPTELGGLANIRSAVERAGGDLAIQWAPRVTVVARYGLEG